MTDLSYLSSPRTEAAEPTVGKLLNKLIPTGDQVKEVFETIPQYAFQDIPELQRLAKTFSFFFFSINMFHFMPLTTSFSVPMVTKLKLMWQSV